MSHSVHSENKIQPGDISDIQEPDLMWGRAATDLVPTAAVHTLRLAWTVSLTVSGEYAIYSQ